MPLSTNRAARTKSDRVTAPKSRSTPPLIDQPMESLSAGFRGSAHRRASSSSVLGSRSGADRFLIGLADAAATISPHDQRGAPVLVLGSDPPFSLALPQKNGPADATWASTTAALALLASRGSGNGCSSPWLDGDDAKSRTPAPVRSSAPNPGPTGSTTGAPPALSAGSVPSQLFFDRGLRGGGRSRVGPPA